MSITIIGGGGARVKVERRWELVEEYTLEAQLPEPPGDRPLLQAFPYHLSGGRLALVVGLLYSGLELFEEVHELSASGVRPLNALNNLFASLDPANYYYTLYPLPHNTGPYLPGDPPAPALLLNLEVNDINANTGTEYLYTPDDRLTVVGTADLNLGETVPNYFTPFAREGATWVHRLDPPRPHAYYYQEDPNTGESTVTAYDTSGTPSTLARYTPVTVGPTTYGGPPLALSRLDGALYIGLVDQTGSFLMFFRYVTGMLTPVTRAYSYPQAELMLEFTPETGLLSPADGGCGKVTCIISYDSNRGTLDYIYLGGTILRFQHGQLQAYARIAELLGLDEPMLRELLSARATHVMRVNGKLRLYVVARPTRTYTEPLKPWSNAPGTPPITGTYDPQTGMVEAGLIRVYEAPE